MGQVPLLVATDVAARGSVTITTAVPKDHFLFSLSSRLHVKQLPLIINWDMPRIFFISNVYDVVVQYYSFVSCNLSILEQGQKILCYVLCIHQFT
jgi:hypothetical protein